MILNKRNSLGILFNFEENCVTEDLSLGDVLVDEKSDSGDIIDDQEGINYINKQIIQILENIAEDMNIPVSQVKMVYLIYLESSQYNETNMRAIKFLPKQVVNEILIRVKEQLAQVLEDEDM